MSRRTVVDPHFATKLRELREARGLSLRALAGHVYYSKSRLHQVETGSKRPTADIATRLDKALDAGGELAAMVNEVFEDPRWTAQATRSASSPPTFSRLEVEEVLAHLREQWHALVRTDNLLGPRHALAGVLGQLTVLTELMLVLEWTVRREVVRLAAQYAESAAWLHEDAGEFAQARMWTSQAMEWAYEADDPIMLAWTAYRRSQQAVIHGDAQHAIALAQAARRREECLALPMRAATRVQEARGHAVAGDERAALQLLDEAHWWAADDVAGDARGGHGSFCTASYIEIHRAGCYALLGKHQAAITCYEQALPKLPAVYRRDRSAALAGQAAVYFAAGQPDAAAVTAGAALPVARRAGSRRIVGQLATVGRRLAPYRHVPSVAALMADLAETV